MSGSPRPRPFAPAASISFREHLVRESRIAVRALGALGALGIARHSQVADGYMILHTGVMINGS